MHNRVVSVTVKPCGYGINLFDVEITEIVSSIKIESYNLAGGHIKDIAMPYSSRVTRYVAEGVSHEDAVDAANTYKRIADVETDYLKALDK